MSTKQLAVVGYGQYRPLAPNDSAENRAAQPADRDRAGRAARSRRGVSARERLAEIHRAALAAVHAGRALERALAKRDPGPGPFALLAAGKAACAMAEAAAARAGRADRARRGDDGRRRLRAGARRTPPFARRAIRFPRTRRVRPPRARRSRAAAGLGADEELLVLDLGRRVGAVVRSPRGHLARRQAPRDARFCSAPRSRSRAQHRSAPPVGDQRRRVSPAPRRGRPVHLLRRCRTSAAIGRPTSARARRAPDPDRAADALAILRRHELARRHARARARAPRRPARAETVRQRTRASTWSRAFADALAAAEAARERTDSARASCPSASTARSARSPRRSPARRGARAPTGFDLLIAGGEPTVAVRGPACGGRAQELALRLGARARRRLDFSGALCGQPTARTAPPTPRERSPTRAASRAPRSAGSTRARTSREATCIALLSPRRATSTSPGRPRPTSPTSRWFCWPGSIRASAPEPVDSSSPPRSSPRRSAGW